MDADKKSTWTTITDVTKPFSGTFVTLLDGVGCELELHTSNTHLRGALKLDGLVFDIRGEVSSKESVAYGVLLEPFSSTPVALLRMTPSGKGMLLELDFPDVDEVLSVGKPIRVGVRSISFSARTFTS